MIRLDGERNASVYNRLGVFSKCKGMKCGVVEGIECSILRWFGHMKKYSGCTRITFSVRQDSVLQYMREKGE